jgi:hypothetical protein
MASRAQDTSGKKPVVAHQIELYMAHMLCATVATPLVKKYLLRISIRAMHSLPFSGTYPICSINRLCVVHMAICATDAKCATSYEKYVPLTFRTGSKKQIFYGIYTQQYIQVYSITTEYIAI